MNRAYLSGGIGVEHNEVFGTEAVPRFSAAVYLRQPSAGSLGDTKVSFNVGKGIKAPSVFQQQSALFELVQGTPAAAERLADRTGAKPRLGHRARTGIRRRAVPCACWLLQQRVRESDRVPRSHRTGSRWRAARRRRGDGIRRVHQLAVVRRAGCGAVGRCGDPARRPVRCVVHLSRRRGHTKPSARARRPIPRFPDVPIGAFSPLVGERPFRRPANSGTLFVSYANGPAAVALSAYFAGKRDDSTFLSDEFFGNSMLLPNQDLDPGVPEGGPQRRRIACTRRPRCSRASRTCSTRNTRRRSASRRCPSRFGRRDVTFGGDR